jgi:hypothetical protein
MLCGLESGSFDVYNCDGDGGACVTVTSIAFPSGPSGNFENLAKLSLPAGGPPWMLCPGDDPLMVGVTFQDNGKVANVTDTVNILSNATGQPTTTMLVVPVVHPVPRFALEPTADFNPDAGETSGLYTGQSLDFTLEDIGDAGINFEFLWYYVCNPAGEETLWIDGGEDEVLVTAQLAATQGCQVCVEAIEFDAGFGNCGFQFGGLDAGPNGQLTFCSPNFVVAP